MITLAETIGLAGGLLQCFGYAAYVRDLQAKGVKLKPSTWVLWTALGWIALFSYIEVNDNYYVAAPFVANGVASLLVTIYAFIKHKVEPLDGTDKFCLAAGILTLLAKYFVSAEAANIVLLGTALCSVIPTYHRLITKPGSERPHAWFIWTGADSLFTLAVFTEWDGSWLAILVPGLRVLANASIGALALRKPKFAAGRAKAAPPSGMVTRTVPSSDGAA